MQALAALFRTPAVSQFWAVSPASLLRAVPRLRVARPGRAAQLQLAPVERAVRLVWAGSLPLLERSPPVARRHRGVQAQRAVRSPRGDCPARVGLSLRAAGSQMAVELQQEAQLAPVESLAPAER